jgi:anti-sigma regulatory factor (Ser/Thr protein kinase)
MPPVSSFGAEEAISVAEDADVAYVQARARLFAERAGLHKRVAWAVAIVASELATNIVKFGAPGKLTLRDLRGRIEIEACDSGPGFLDTHAALRDGVSEGIDRNAVEVAFASRRGLGLGLGAVQRLADTLDIARRAQGGSVITACVRCDRSR